MDSNDLFAIFQIARTFRQDAFDLLDKAKNDSSSPPVVAALIGASDAAHQVVFHTYAAYLGALEAEGAGDWEPKCVNWPVDD